MYICECPTPDSHYCMFIKGAPEKVWNMSSHLLCHDKEVLIEDAEKKAYTGVNKTFAKNGERVLGFAKYHFPKSTYPKSYHFNVKSPD